MPKFRTIPVVKEAHQLPPINVLASQELVDFIDQSERTSTSERDGGLAIETLEGVVTAGPGDWIIKGLEGEYYPCKDSIFKMTYEPVED